jgi:hypothetical protein
MNLSNLSRTVISQIGETQGGMFFLRLSPLQIMIMSVTREEGWRIDKALRGKRRTEKAGLLFASDVRKLIEDLYKESNNSPYSTQGFWVAISQLKKLGYVYVAPHKKGTSKRTICLTAIGEALFTYPQSIQLYTQPRP